MSCTPGAGGGARALEHLRAIIKNIGGDVLTLQVAVPNAYSAFTPQGQIEQEAIKQQLKQELQELSKGALQPLRP